MALQLFKIASTTVETPQSTVTFSSIPQGYTDLLLMSSTRDDRSGATATGLRLTFNGSSTGFTGRYLEGSGSTASSGSTSTPDWGSENGPSSTANCFTSTQLYIPNYTSSNYKSYSSESAMEQNATTAYLDMWAGLWSNTAAITSLGLVAGTGNFVAGSTFTLYGVL